MWQPVRVRRVQEGEVGRPWEPDRRAERVMAVGAMVLLAVGTFVHVLLWSAGRGWQESSLGPAALLIGLVVTLVALGVIVVVHELLHGAVILALGGRPTFGAGRTEEGGLAFFYTTAPGQLFNRREYAVVALAPLVLLGGLLAWWVWAWPLGGWLVVPAALHLSGCVGDLGLTWLALRQPRGTLIEDRKVGVAFHDPDGT